MTDLIGEISDAGLRANSSLWRWARLTPSASATHTLTHYRRRSGKSAAALQVERRAKTPAKQQICRNDRFDEAFYHSRKGDDHGPPQKNWMLSRC